MRAFLYGVGWAAISLSIQMWMWIADQTIDPGAGVIVSVIAALAAVVAFQIAKRRLPNKSWSHAIYGWLWGFVTGSSGRVVAGPLGLAGAPGDNKLLCLSVAQTHLAANQLAAVGKVAGGQLGVVVIEPVDFVQGGLSGRGRPSSRALQ